MCKENNYLITHLCEIKIENTEIQILGKLNKRTDLKKNLQP